jgi:hypothetical protein
MDTCSGKIKIQKQYQNAVPIRRFVLLYHCVAFPIHGVGWHAFCFAYQRQLLIGFTKKAERTGPVDLGKVLQLANGEKLIDDLEFHVSLSLFCAFISCSQQQCYARDLVFQLIALGLLALNIAIKQL